MSKPHKPPGEKAVRTTITLNPRVFEWAEQMRKEEGFNSLSDFLAELVRRRKEMADPGKAVQYPRHQDQHATTEERPQESIYDKIPKEKKVIKIKPPKAN